MATGDVVQATRPRAVTNMRYDLLDFLLLSEAFNEFMDACTRALLSETLATPASPTGEQWYGRLKTNPVPADGKVEVRSALFSGLDADGRLVLKPDGTVLQVVIPDDSSDYQVYLYMDENTESSAVRRRLPAAAPFTEFTQAIDIAIRGAAILHTRSGGAGTIVAEDVVSGATRPLLFLGIANNTGGTVTFTPAANRLETVTVPGTLPGSSTGNTAGGETQTGATKTLRGMCNNALHGLARDRWKGSNNYTPSAGNNYGAYTEPDGGGLDASHRGLRGAITIGDDAASIYGDFDRDAYASDDLCFAAVIAALPSQGGVVYIKPGVVLDNWNGDVTIPAGTDVHFVGGGSRKPGASFVPDIVFDTYNFICSDATGDPTWISFEKLNIYTPHATASGTFIELHDEVNLTVIDCSMAVVTTNVLDPAAMVTINAAAVGTGLLYFERVYHRYTSACAAAGTVGCFLDTNGVRCGVPFSYPVTFKDCFFVVSSTANGRWPILVLDDVRGDVRIQNCDFYDTGNTNAVPATGGAAIIMTSTVNTLWQRAGRIIENCTFVGRITTAGPTYQNLNGVELNDITNVQVKGCVFDNCVDGILWDGSALDLTANLLIRDCQFLDSGGRPVFISAEGGHVITGIEIASCIVHDSTANFEFSKVGGVGITGIEHLRIHHCEFVNSHFRILTSLTDAIIENCLFVDDGTGAAPEIWNTGVTALTNVAFRNNTVRGFEHATGVDNAFGVLVRTASVKNLDVSGNLFTDLQNVAYTGVGPSGEHHIIRINCGTAEGVKIHNNQFNNIASSLSGGNAEPPMLISLDSQSGGVSTTLVENLSIQGNVASDNAAQILFLVCRNHSLDAVVITNNTWTRHHTSLVQAGSAYHDIHFLFQNGATVRGLIFVGNTERVINAIGGAINKHVLAFEMVSGAGQIYALRISENSWIANVDGWGTGTTTGVMVDVTTNYFMLKNNLGLAENWAGSGVNDRFHVYLATVPTVTEPTPLPGVGSYFSDNINCQRQ